MIVQNIQVFQIPGVLEICQFSASRALSHYLLFESIRKMWIELPMSFHRSALDQFRLPGRHVGGSNSLASYNFIILRSRST